MDDDPTPDVLIAGLGANPTEIAATLANKGIVGIPGCPQFCPLAVYLRGQGYEYPSISTRITVGESRVEYDLPLPALMFVSAYDSGAFPELERPPAPPSDGF